MNPIQILDIRERNKIQGIEVQSIPCCRGEWCDLTFISSGLHSIFHLPSHHPAARNDQTPIEKLFVGEYKAFSPCKQATISKRESSEEIYICIIFCCFKRQIKFYLFCASPVFVFLRWNTRYLFLRIGGEDGSGKMVERISRDPFPVKKECEQKKSNLFVRCLYDSINPPTENVICIHRSLFCCFSLRPFFAFLSSKAKALRRHKSFIQNHSIVFPSRNFFICVRESFYFVFDGETLRSVMKCKSSFWRISRGAKRWKGEKRDRFNKLGG